jgi:hypothetical protein
LNPVLFVLLLILELIFDFNKLKEVVFILFTTYLSIKAREYEENSIKQF